MLVDIYTITQRHILAYH